MVADGMIMKRKRKHFFREMRLKMGLLAKMSLALESFDLAKDWGYLLAFQHAFFATILLIISMVLPFAILD